MASVNKAILIGNLGADPESRTLEGSGHGSDDFFAGQDVALDGVVLSDDTTGPVGTALASVGVRVALEVDDAELTRGTSFVLPSQGFRHLLW